MSRSSAARLPPGRRSGGAVPLLIVLVLVVLGAVVGGAVGTARGTTYEGVSVLQAHAVSAGQARSSALLSATTPSDPRDIAAADAQLVQRADVVAAARAALGPTDADATASARALSGQTLVEVTARDDDRQRAADRARAFADALRATQLRTTRESFARTAAALERRERTTGSLPASVAADLVVLRTLSTRVVPLQIVRVGAVREVHPSPSTAGLALVGAAAGLVVALVLLALRRIGRAAPEGGYVSSPGAVPTPDPSVAAASVPESAAAPTPSSVATLALDRRASGSPSSLLPVDADGLAAFSGVLEEARRIAPGEPRVVLLTAPAAGPSADGPALGAAVAGTASGLRVLLLDADAEDGRIGAVDGLRAAPGFGDYLAGRARPEETLQRLPAARLLAAGIGGAGARDLVVVTAGSAADRDLRSPRLAEMFADLRRGYDLVVVSATVADGVDELAALADVVLVHVGGDRVDDPLVEEALERLRGSATGPVGVVGTARRSRWSQR